ncbi:MAG TPA: hypothetical protein VK038_11360 [Ornithinicoccus sp.]|jgi:hypothetical protein|nr:hypothetical protein [Ornithinicoccus sp.]
MSEPRPQRVRVTGPPRRPVPSRRTDDIAEETRLGAVYLSSLMSAQLALALRVGAVLAVLVGSLPLVFHLLPGLARVSVLGLPLSWLVLGVLVYPVLVVLGWVYVRGAERNESAFAELLDESGQQDG